jgi:hypothetical protein
VGEEGFIRLEKEFGVPLWRPPHARTVKDVSSFFMLDLTFADVFGFVGILAFLCE